MTIQSRLNIIVLIFTLTIIGLYGYILKITLDIEVELEQLELIEEFEDHVSQLGLITEYYLANPEQRYEQSWMTLISQIEFLSDDVEEFRQNNIVRESIPSIRKAFELIILINNNPEHYPVEGLREELSKRATTRIRSDVRQLVTISNSVALEHIVTIKTLQVDQRLYYLMIFIPAFIVLILMAYFMQRRIISSLTALRDGIRAFAGGRLDYRIQLKGDDEIREIAAQFNQMAEEHERLLAQEKKLNRQLEMKAEELKRSNEELDKFASVASHDLKEPLRMIRNFTQLLEKNYADNLDDKARKYIRFSADGAERMTILIDDLLEFARVGRKYTQFENVDVHDLLEQVIGFFESEIDEKEVKISWGEMPEVYAVPVSLRLVFQNLIGNSLKYQKPGAKPEIRIEADEHPGFWEFSISDNGIGIEKEYLEEVFQLFKRLHSSRDYSGTGMGLATCKKIIEQHGGGIWAESELGKGSTFYFTLRKQNELFNVQNQKN